MEESGFFTRLFFNPTDGAIFETLFHVAALGVASIAVYEIFDLRKKVYQPIARSIGIESAPKQLRLSSPTSVRGGM